MGSQIHHAITLLFLVILLIKGLTLDGAWNGIKTYWDFSNWDELSSSGIWNAAIGQCFFSLSVCMGVMTAYGSYNPIRQDIATDEKVIAFLDVFASLMSGFVVYCILGFLVFDCTANPGEFMDVTWVEAGEMCLCTAPNNGTMFSAADVCTSSMTVGCWNATTCSFTPDTPSPTEADY